MAVAWNFYSARRRVSIKQYVDRRKLGSYDEFVTDLAGRGIAAPSKEQYTAEVVGVVKATPPQPKVKSKPSTQKPKPKPKPNRSSSKKTKTSLPVSAADEAWEAVNSEYSDKDKK